MRAEAISGVRRMVLVLALAGCSGTEPSAALSSAGQAGIAAAGSAGVGGASGAAGSSSAGSAAVAAGGAGASAGSSAGGGAQTGDSAGGGVGGATTSAGAAGSAGERSIDHELPGKIVVLGSSTSAGTGPKDPNNAYVPRYQAYLAEQFPHFTLVNLAVGGQTTYQIQPTGFTPPANRPQPVEGKNITAALALQPDAILVNMPSNDTAANIPPSEQFTNFTRLAMLANAAHVLFWVTTTQPRNFDNAQQIADQISVRDWLLTTYAPRTLDFWTPVATADGKIKPEYGAGDGIHLNDAAHALLRDVVVAARIPETVLLGRP